MSRTPKMQSITNVGFDMIKNSLSVLSLFMVLVSAGVAFTNTNVVVSAAENTIAVNTHEQEAPFINNDKCTLAEAIQSANTNTAIGECTAGSDIDTDKIVLPEGILNLTKAYGDTFTAFPTISGNVKIVGAQDNKTVIRRSNDAKTDIRGRVAPFFNMFVVGAEGNLNLENVTVKGSYVMDVAGNANKTDRTTYYHPAIVVRGDLTTDNVIMEQNLGSRANDILVYGTANILNTTFRNSNLPLNVAKPPSGTSQDDLNKWVNEWGTVNFEGGNGRVVNSTCENNLNGWAGCFLGWYGAVVDLDKVNIKNAPIYPDRGNGHGAVNWAGDGTKELNWDAFPSKYWKSGPAPKVETGKGKMNIKDSTISNTSGDSVTGNNIYLTNTNITNSAKNGVNIASGKIVGGKIENNNQNGVVLRPYDKDVVQELSIESTRINNNKLAGVSVESQNNNLTNTQINPIILKKNTIVDNLGGNVLLNNNTKPAVTISETVTFNKTSNKNNISLTSGDISLNEKANENGPKLNFSVITSVKVVENGGMVVEGYAPKNSDVEIFKSNGNVKNTRGRGEAVEFLGKYKEGSQADGNSAQGSYGTTVNNQTVAKGQITTELFKFTIPSSVIGNRLVAGDYIAATATKNNYTSELSNNVSIVFETNQQLTLDKIKDTTDCNGAKSVNLNEVATCTFELISLPGSQSYTLGNVTAQLDGASDNGLCNLKEGTRFTLICSIPTKGLTFPNGTSELVKDIKLTVNGQTGVKGKLKVKNPLTPGGPINPTNPGGNDPQLPIPTMSTIRSGGLAFGSTGLLTMAGLLYKKTRKNRL